MQKFRHFGVKNKMASKFDRRQLCLQPLNLLWFSFQPTNQIQELRESLWRIVRRIWMFILGLMPGSILPVTIPPPGTPPGICNFFLTWRSIPHPRAHRKRQFPTPGTPHRPESEIRCFVFKIDFRTIAQPDVLTRT